MFNFNRRNFALFHTVSLHFARSQKEIEIISGKDIELGKIETVRIY